MVKKQNVLISSSSGISKLFHLELRGVQKAQYLKSELKKTHGEGGMAVLVGQSPCVFYYVA